jgi:hypothetical protein
MICKYCGKEMSDQARFCPGCGRPVEVSVVHEKSSIKILLIAVAVLAVVSVGIGVFAGTQMLQKKADHVVMAEANIMDADMQVASEKSGLDTATGVITDETTTAVAAEAVIVGWQQDDHGWKYLDQQGEPQPEGWFTDTDGSQYYFDADGYMLADTVTPDGYYVNASGAYQSKFVSEQFEPNEDTVNTSATQDSNTADNNSNVLLNLELSEIIKIIRNNYYAIQEDVKNYTTSKADSFEWYSNNGILRKVVLKPDTYELRDLTEEFYYDENNMLLFAFTYGSGQEYRYYYYAGLLYRYIDAKGTTYDYENGIDPWEVENAGKLKSDGEREKHLFYNISFME